MIFLNNMAANSHLIQKKCQWLHSVVESLHALKMTCYGWVTSYMTDWGQLQLLSTPNCTRINPWAHGFSGETCPHPSSSRRGSSIVIVGSLGLLSSWSTAIEKLSHRKCSHDMSVCKVKLNRNKATFILASVYVHQCPCYQAPLYTGILCIYIIYIMYAWVEPNNGFLIQITFRGTWTFALTISQSAKSDLPNNYYRHTVGTNEQIKTAV